MREAVGRWARAKLASGRVGGWNGGRGREGGTGEAVQMCKGGKVGRKNKGTSGRVDWWEGGGAKKIRHKNGVRHY